MIIHFIHWNADTLRTGSLLFLIGLRARWMRIRNAVWLRINRHFARRLRHHTAHIRAVHGRTAVPLPGPRKNAAEQRLRRHPLPAR